MKLKYKSSKGSRINYNFLGFTTFEKGWWFNYNSNKWEINPEVGIKGYSSHQPCKSVKSFRRKLKKAPYGVNFILVSRWKGCDVFGKGGNNQLTHY